MPACEERDDPWEEEEPPLSGRPSKRCLGRINHPIYFRCLDTPEGHVIKQFPDGSRQLVRFVGLEEQVVKQIP